MQVLQDLYEVTFNDVTKTKTGNVIYHNDDRNLNIFLGNRLTIQVAKSQLEELSKYGNGFKTQKLLQKACIWSSSPKTVSVANNTNKTNGFLFRMVEEP